jgi:hypothetical protein
MINYNQELISENCIFLNESKFNQTFMILNVKPRLSQVEMLKRHEHPGLLHLINKTNKIEDLKYLRSDAYMGMRQFNRLKQNYEKYDGLHRNSKLESLKKNGITSSDFDKYINWLQKIYLPKINEKIKQLKKG